MPYNDADLLFRNFLILLQNVEKFSLWSILQNEVYIFHIPKISIKSKYIMVIQTALYNDFSFDLFFKIIFPQLIFTHFLDRNRITSLLFFRSINIPKFPSSHLFYQLKVSNFPISWCSVTLKGCLFKIFKFYIDFSFLHRTGRILPRSRILTTIIWSICLLVLHIL